MPLYQYKCRDCEQSFERRLPMSQSADVQVCPECGSEDTRKQLGAFAVGGSTSTLRSPATESRPSPFR